MIRVTFRDGHFGWYLRNDIGGAFIGEPTVFVHRDQQTVFVKPIGNGDFVEA